MNSLRHIGYKYHLNAVNYNQSTKTAVNLITSEKRWDELAEEFSFFPKETSGFDFSKYSIIWMRTETSSRNRLLAYNLNVTAGKVEVLITELQATAASPFATADIVGYSGWVAVKRMDPSCELSFSLNKHMTHLEYKGDKPDVTGYEKLSKEELKSLTEELDRVEKEEDHRSDLILDIMTGPKLTIALRPELLSNDGLG